MRSRDSAICFVGPLPPPVHGFSEINRRMLLALREKHFVLVFDMAPHSNQLSFVNTWWRFLVYALRNKPSALYLALSGGSRQWVDLAFLLVARLRGIPIFVHHHSFSYLNKKIPSASLCLRFLRSATHIVLCSCMGEKLISQYALDQRNLRVLSNAAFLEDIACPEINTPFTSSLRLGFLSNITAEKGIHEFFSVLRKASSVGLALKGVIAGPVDASIRDSFAASLAASANVRHIGPVYGADKKSFFANIDVLFFPTRYPNEAEPVTILEALGHGVPVIAFDRGCIGGMLPDSAGQVINYSAHFVEQAIAAIRPLAESPAKLANARRAAKASFEVSLTTNKALLDELIAEIGGARSYQQVPS